MAIVRSKGYVQLRRGLFEHVQNGEMSIGECFLYMAILANADPATGIWISSAGMLASFYSIPDRTCKDWLAKLEEKRYLRRFMVQGKRGQYPIMVHKFQCTEGALKGMRLNAWESESCTSPKYEPCPDGCTESAGAGALTVPQSTREGEKKRRNTPPQPVLENIYQAYPKHVGKQAALAAIESAIRKISPTRDAQWLLRQVEAYADQRIGKDDHPKYTPNPQTWFNQGRYDDDALQPKEKVLWTTMDGTPVNGGQNDARSTT